MLLIGWVVQCVVDWLGLLFVLPCELCVLDYYTSHGYLVYSFFNGCILYKNI